MLHQRLLLLGLIALLSGCLSPVATTVPTRETQAEQTPTEPNRANPKAIVPITYEDLDLPMEPDSVFHDYLLTQRVRDLDGKRVRITGFMHSGSLYASRNIKQFIMLRENEKDCPFGPGGQAHHAMAVTLSEAKANFTTLPITVEGVLSVQPFAAENGNALYVYVLQSASIK